MKSFGTIVKYTVNGLFMQSVADKKGWSKSQAKDKVVEFLTCGTKKSLYDFMSEA